MSIVVSPLRQLVFAYERKIHLKRLAEADARLPGPVGRDENNFFSLQEALGVPDIKAVSFDFFDTLFFRQHLCLAQVMEKTAQLSAPLVDAKRTDVLSAIYASRGYASWQLKRTMQLGGVGDEPKLCDILSRSLSHIVPDSTERAALSEKIVAIETDIELRNLEANNQIESVFRNLRRLGKKVIITSDMYLPGSALQKVLEKHGLMDLIDELIVSADFGITKNSGELFKVVIERAGVDPSQILHVGDNWTNDVARARENGLQAYHYFNHARETEVKKLEARFNIPSANSIREQSLCRDFGLGGGASYSSLDDIVSKVIGPACALFVHGVLQKAARKKSSEIFFLTRDGTIFKEIADAMRDANPSLYPGSAETKILACSRSTGVLMGVKRTDSDYLYANTEYLTEKKFSFREFLDVFGVPLDRLEQLSSHTQSQIEQLGDDMELVEFRDLYWSCQDFQDLVMETLEAKRAPMLKYLENTGLFDANAPLLVDIGYSGTWGKQLSLILEERERAGLPVADLSFEFFATNRFFTNNVRQMHPSIMMSAGKILDHRKSDCLTASLNYSWLEPFFLDPALGKLNGFSSDDAPQPEFKDSNFNAADKARIQGLRHALVGRCVQFSEDLMRYEGDVEELHRIVLKRLTRLVCHPTRTEARCINQLTHERGMKSISRQEISLRIAPNNLRAKLGYLMENDHWVQGSLALSGLGPLNHYVAWRYSRDRSEFVDWRP